jgi:hypothetical protein
MRRALLSSSFGFLALALVLACSGGSDVTAGDGGALPNEAGSTDAVSADGSSGAITDANAGDGDATGAITPQAIVQVYGGAAAGCSTVPPLFVGDFGDPQAGKPPVPVKDGASQDGGAVSVSCSVIAIGSTGFDFAASVTYAGTKLDLTATLDASGKTTAAKMVLQKSATWTSSTCKLEPTTAQMGVGVGRYWGSMSCIQATSGANDKCDIFGQVRFEDCAQK